MPSPDPTARVERVENCPASFFRYLYVEVGRNYHWRDRLAWTDEDIRDRLADPSVSLHLLSVGGGPAGYFELQRHADGSVEIVYFGLLPEFLGRGLGKYLLGEAVAVAVAARRVARVAAHLLARRPGRAAELPRPRFPSLPAETYEAELPITRRRFTRSS